jgi:soluble lytic murein transglycosylase-like protein
VVFGTGEVLKVAAFEIDQGDILLRLPSGGRMRLPIGRIARILDDEIEEPLPPPVIAPPPPFELSFLPTHPVPTAPYGDLIHSAARRYQVNPELVRAVIRCESAFNPWATSPRGAAGLMQLMPATAERFGITSDDRWDPERNLNAGVAYLRWLVDHFDRELPLVLAAFNSGEGAVERYQGIPPYRETREYVRRVYSELGMQAPGAPGAVTASAAKAAAVAPSVVASAPAGL